MTSLGVEEGMPLIPLTDAQRDELNWRLDELDRDGPAGIAWEDVVSRIKSQSG
jgi:putative addiction module component (TIGR02574 family)